MDSNSPRIGHEVYTTDGSKLGTIKEVQGAYFKVDASMKPDYWLASECVRGAMGSRLSVAFDKADLDRYKREKAMS